MLKPSLWIIGLMTLALAVSAAPPAADNGEARLLSAYRAVQEAMAKDAFPEAREKAKALKTEAETWLRKKSAASAQQANLDEIVKASDELSQKEAAADLHAAFGRISKGVVHLVKAAPPAIQAKWQLFFCPMTPTYGYWTQPEGESLANPYYGKAMLTCGVNRKWSALR